MSGIKKLAGQTLWYGVPTMVSRFLNFLLSVLLVGIFKPGDFGTITQFYAFFPFFNIIFTYGLETAYFRFSQTHDQKRLYNTLNISIFASTIFFTILLLATRGWISHVMNLNGHTGYITIMAWTLFFDTLAVLPFSRLRREERPRRFALIRTVNIVTNILMVLFYYQLCPGLSVSMPSLFSWYEPGNVVYVFHANLIASIITLLLLMPQFKGVKIVFSEKLWKEVMGYAYPLIIVGLGGMINEMLSRAVYPVVSPDSPEKTKFDLGVFGANYKLAVLITIFIQVFRMAAEPFFFNKSKDSDAPRAYARVMKFFVIACCFMFLGVTLFLDIWKYLIIWKHPEYGEGLNIVPILAMGSVFLGIYYNLSVWYKLTNKNMTGAWITLAGAAITVLLNFLLIPYLRYTGSAWATLICYFYMMVASYRLGQKHYPIPYARKKLMTYLVISILLFLAHRGLTWLYPPVWFNLALGGILFGLFALLILKVERKELKQLPFIGRWL